ncbi:MAG: hypothetical protein ABR511_03630 [Acidimicrobiales bacterium]
MEAPPPTPIRALGPVLGRRLSVLDRPVVVAAAVAAMVGGSVLLRMEGLGEWFWMDEGISVGIASHPLARIPGLMARDGSPPLYYLLLHGWMRLFGGSEVATHALSLSVAVMAIPVGLWAGWSLFGRRVGWITAVLLATCPFISTYSSETRMYTLVILEGLVATASYLHAFVDDRPRYAAVFVVAMVALLYTHNWGLYVGLAAVLGLVPCCARLAPEARRRLLVRAGAAFGAIGVLYLPWVPTLLRQARHTGAPWSPVPSARLAVSTLAEVLGDPTERVLIVLVLTAAVALVSILRRTTTREGRAAAALVVLVAVTLGVGWLASQVKPAWSVRYLGALLPALVLLAALGLARAGARGVLGLLLIMVIWTEPVGRLTGDRHAVHRDGKASDKALAAVARPVLRAGDLVLATQMEEVPVLRHYLGPRLRYADPTGLVADPSVADWRDATARLDAARPAAWLPSVIDTLPAGGHVYLVCPASTDTPGMTWFRIMDARCGEAAATLQSTSSLTRVPLSFSRDAIEGGARTVLLFEKAGL